MIETYERLPMSAIECEADLIGAALAAIQNPEDWSAALDVCTGKHFLNEDYGRAWDTIVAIRKSGRPVDLPLVVAELRRAGFANVAELVSDVSDRIPHTLEMPHYSEQVVEAWRMRQLQSLAAAIHSNAVAGCEGGADKIIASALQRLSVLQSEAAGDSAITLSEAMAGVIQSKAEQRVTRLPTKIDSLDVIIGGIPIGYFTLVGGRPGMGKSQLVKQILLNSATANTPSLLVTVEEDRNKVAENSLANLSGIANHRIVMNRLDAADLQLMEEWATASAKLQYWIEDVHFSLPSICRCIRKHAAKNKVKLVGVDYIQIIEPGIKAENANRAVTVLSQTLKRLARELGIGLIVAAQLNREGAKNGERPKLTDLRDSGSLEQDGDLVMLLHREDYYHSGGDPTNIVEVDVAKNKGGKRGVVELRWDGDRQRISEIEVIP